MDAPAAPIAHAVPHKGIERQQRRSHPYAGVELIEIMKLAGGPHFAGDHQRHQRQRQRAQRAEDARINFARFRAARGGPPMVKHHARQPAGRCEWQQHRHHAPVRAQAGVLEQRPAHRHPAAQQHKSQVPLGHSPMLAPHHARHEEQQPHRPQRDVVFPVAIKPQWRQHSYEQPAQGAAAGDAQKILRQPRRLRAQTIQLAVAHHAADEQRAAVQGNLQDDVHIHPFIQRPKHTEPQRH